MLSVTVELLCQWGLALFTNMDIIFEDCTRYMENKMSWKLGACAFQRNKQNTSEFWGTKTTEKTQIIWKERKSAI